MHIVNNFLLNFRFLILRSELHPGGNTFQHSPFGGAPLKDSIEEWAPPKVQGRILKGISRWVKPTPQYLGVSFFHRLITGHRLKC